MATRRLDEATSTEGLAILAPDPGVVAYVGAEPGGIDWVCACGHVLASSVREGEIWELAFRCPMCARVWLGPSLPPGHPLPQRVVGFPEGTYRLSDSVVGKPAVVLTTIDAAERRFREVGLDLVNRERRLESGSDLKELLRQAEQVFAAVLTRIREDDRARASVAPRHRLLELMEMIGESVTTMDAPVPAIDAPAVVELHATIEVFERWARDPAWTSYVSTLRNPTDFAHNLMTLLLATWLIEAGNGVALDPNRGGLRRASDLWITVRPELRFVVEVKVPLALVRPRQCLTPTLAERIARRQLSRAGTEPGDQLGPENPGALAIGGFQLACADLDMLEDAAANLLAQSDSAWAHIAAINVVAWGVLIDESAERPSLHATLEIRKASNPHYRGDPPISEEMNPRLRPVEGELREFQFDDGDLSP